MSLSNLSEHLTVEEKYLISVLGAALKDKDASPFPEELDPKVFCTLCSDQCVAPLAYDALKGLVLPEKARTYLNDLYEKAVLLEAKQEAEAERIFAAFSENKIRFIPLKGIEIKRLYSHPECRTMSDIDIFIDEKDFSSANKIMRSIGFEYRGRLSYQHQYECGGVSVELHFALWGYDFEKIGGFDSLFDFAGNVSGTSMYRLSSEFTYVFLIAHLAKHLKASGIGVRAFLDIYVYSIRFGKTMDWGIINKYLVEMGLDRFAVRIKELIGAWFYSRGFDGDVETMTKYIMVSYTHGTRRQEAAASLSDGSSKAGKKISLLFPSMSYMKRRFLILNKLPFLYPFCWLIRLLGAPFSKKKRQSSDFKALDSVSKEDVENVSKALKAFGISDRSDLPVNGKENKPADKDKPKIDFESEDIEEHRRRTFAFAGVALLLLVGSAAIFYFTFFVKTDVRDLPAIPDRTGTQISVSDTATTDAVNPGDSVYASFPYKNGVYSGWSVDGVPNGSGELKFTNEDKYIGNFKDGEFNGNGKLYTGGDIYEGEFINGVLNGRVSVYYADGNVYEGDYLNGEQTGTGKYTWSNGDYYEGDFTGGIRSGNGKYTWVKNGREYAVYEGEWQDNTQNGHGKYTDGKITYEGEYLDGVFNGRGVYTWSEGVYTGKFEFGEQNDDKAVIEYKSKGKTTGKYEGPVVNGVIQGNGTYTMSNGDIVKGTFTDGLLNGEAQYYYAATKKWVKVKYEKGKIISA